MSELSELSALELELLSSPPPADTPAKQKAAIVIGVSPSNPPGTGPPPPPATPTLVMSSLLYPLLQSKVQEAVRTTARALKTPTAVSQRCHVSLVGNPNRLGEFSNLFEKWVSALMGAQFTTSWYKHARDLKKAHAGKTQTHDSSLLKYGPLEEGGSPLPSAGRQCVKRCAVLWCCPFSLRHLCLWL